MATTVDGTPYVTSSDSIVTYPSTSLDLANRVDSVSASPTLALGSASAPSLRFKGDSNTGLWSPAADTVAFSTGGSERMRITSAGNVGIGTTSPATFIHVAGQAAGAAGIYVDQYSTDAAGPGVLTRKARGTSASPSAVQSGDYITALLGRGYGATAFGTSNVGLAGFVAAENFTDSAQGTNFVVGTTPTGSTTRTERMRIDSNGNTFGVAAQNLLYNGAMQVAQRGTSTASITVAGYYTADRWITSISGLGTWTSSVENDAPTGSGLRRSSKVLCSTAAASPAASGQAAFVQRLEGQDVQRIAKGTASVQQLTLSFWVKSNVTGTYVAYLYDNDNNRICSASYTVSASAAWEKKTITFPADTTGALDNDNADSFSVAFQLAAGSNFTSGTLQTTWASYTAANQAVGQVNLGSAINNYWQVTGVQLEVGPIASPFQFKSYGQELRECQRYYYRLNLETQGYSRFGIGFARTTSQVQLLVNNPMPMRIVPSAITTGGTIAVYDGITLTNTTAITLNLGGLTVQTLDADVSGTPLTQYRPHTLIGNNSTTAFIAFTAEL